MKITLIYHLQILVAHLLTCTSKISCKWNLRNWSIIHPKFKTNSFCLCSPLHEILCDHSHSFFVWNILIVNKRLLLQHVIFKLHVLTNVGIQVINVTGSKRVSWSLNFQLAPKIRVEELNSWTCAFCLAILPHFWW